MIPDCLLPPASLGASPVSPSLQGPRASINIPHLWAYSWTMCSYSLGADEHTAQKEEHVLFFLLFAFYRHRYCLFMAQRLCRFKEKNMCWGAKLQIALHIYPNIWDAGAGIFRSCSNPFFLSVWQMLNWPLFCLCCPQIYLTIFPHYHTDTLGHDTVCCPVTANDCQVRYSLQSVACLEQYPEQQDNSRKKTWCKEIKEDLEKLR